MIVISFYKMNEEKEMLQWLVGNILKVRSHRMW